LKYVIYPHHSIIITPIILKVKTCSTYLITMKLNFFLIIPFTAVLGGVFERNKPGCDSDNCARAVTGTRLGAVAVSSHVADCLSFQQVTTYYGA
jgi:hypothetical protein